MSECICEIPSHWPKHALWAHLEHCPWRAAEKRRICESP